MGSNIVLVMVTYLAFGKAEIFIYTNLYGEMHNNIYVLRLDIVNKHCFTIFKNLHSIIHA